MDVIIDNLSIMLYIITIDTDSVVISSPNNNDYGIGYNDYKN